ncbi:hypothetical protein DL89DRAFT_136551 [Linderina pennispora]|uniref:Ubiquitin-like domain-containing protein n=1 Tax=Linderina pennispora TaxID=61395 RepID=A0A1Y1WAR3_9FUNG|nr:uncharacterized protein DL89DRAFT_136551 [Linderina pennispora]ORX70621.1 hypothetical protein DL89DRAFT_136551 [Linderina pennispora]
MGFINLVSFVTIALVVGAVVIRMLSDTLIPPPYLKLYLNIVIPTKINHQGKITEPKKYIDIIYINTQHTVGNMKEDIRQQLLSEIGAMPLRIKLNGYDLLDSSRIKYLMKDEDKLTVYVNQTYS